MQKKNGDDDDQSEEDDDKLPEDLDKVKIDYILDKTKKKKDMKLVTDVDLLKRFYGNDKQLDNTDKFLRNYILLEGWKDKFKGVGNL